MQAFIIEVTKQCEKIIILGFGSSPIRNKQVWTSQPPLKYPKQFLHLSERQTGNTESQITPTSQV